MTDDDLNWTEVFESAKHDGLRRYESIATKLEGESRVDFIRRRNSVRSEPVVQFARSLTAAANLSSTKVPEIPSALARFYQISDGSNGMSEFLPIAIPVVEELLETIQTRLETNEKSGGPPHFQEYLCQLGVYGNRIPLYVWSNAPCGEVVVVSHVDRDIRIVSSDIDSLFNRIAFCIRASVPFDFNRINPKLVEFIKSTEGPEYLPGGRVGRKRFSIDSPDKFPNHWIPPNAE